MIRIKYKAGKGVLEKAYKEIFVFSESLRNEYEELRKKIDKGLPKKMEDILVLPINLLANICFDVLPKIHGKGAEEMLLRKRIISVFNYNVNHKKIAEFFMEHASEIALKTCYYCNIEFINKFKDIPDYTDAFDFVRKCKDDDLLKVKGIGDDTVKRIKAIRRGIKTLKDLRLRKNQLSNIENFVLNISHNHFTLDHVLNKAMHPFAALSLYNFVPCCYSCNSKFKGERKLIEDKSEVFLSPTYDGFDFNEKVRYKLYNNNLTSASISKETDFCVRPAEGVGISGYENLLNIFKLEGRYICHKREVVSLVGKSTRYSPAKIREIAKLMKMPEATVKADIFGRNLFEGALEDAPFTKYLRDIADNIGIEGVKTTD